MDKEDVSIIASLVSEINYAGMNGKATNLEENVTLEYAIDVSSIIDNAHLYKDLISQFRFHKKKTL